MNENNIANVNEEEVEHRNLYEIMYQFWVEIYNFFKYIFYDLPLGNG